MATGPADVDEECFVYPAITKRYSQITPPNLSDHQNDPLIANLGNPAPAPKRPLRSTLKSPPKISSEPNGNSSAMHATIYSYKERTSNEKVTGKGDADHQLKAGQLPHWNNSAEGYRESVVQFNEKGLVPKRTSIQHLRKYSVVDPNAIEFLDESTSKTYDCGICSAILMTTSYLLIVFTFPFSLFFCVKVVAEYERAVIFRLGRILPHGARGPGLFFVVPCIDNIRIVDLRTVTFDVPPQEVLTKDSVTVAVDAVVYYRIYNPVVAITNVEDADRSTRLLAATTLRNCLGTRNLADILSERESISTSMQTMLDDATDPWGVKVERVEVKDVRLPVQLQRAMAAEAEATREARAKVIAAEGEEKSSFALKQAADVIKSSPFALQLRYLQTLSAISAEKNSTIIFPLPIDLLVNFIPPTR